ncbi:hypothetical protein EMCRGX_G023889 [Ephydatia muelleri]
MEVEPDQLEEELPMLKLPNRLQEILCTTNSTSIQHHCQVLVERQKDGLEAFSFADALRCSSGKPPSWLLSTRLSQ